MSTELVRPHERQIRSYHRAFSVELTLYSLGGNLRLWRPIAARQVFWSAGLFVLVFIGAHALRLHPPVLAGVLLYIAVPLGLAYLLSIAKVQGRRLHVVFGAWGRHLVRGHRLVGGHQRLSFRPGQTCGFSRIRVSPVYQPRRLQPRYAVVLLPVIPVVTAAMVLHSALAPRSGAAPRPVASVAAPVVKVLPRPIVQPVVIKMPLKTPLVRRPSRKGAVDVAHQFANAYLSYQVGRDTPAVQAQFRATCTPQFAALLSGSPVGGSYEPFHVDAVSYQPPRLVIVRFSNRQHQHGTLHVHVQASVSGAWQVAGLS